ncbi:MAG: energy-coupled thiamine transporter ThiT [Chloroflexi bacterium]|nr:energy-coupled thiamine transporter ThiT [Chloroflexota bacterium]
MNTIKPLEGKDLPFFYEEYRMPEAQKKFIAGKPFIDVPTLLEIGVALSMALLLAFFLKKIFLAPAYVPLYYITYRKGPKLGMFACMVFAFITTPLAMTSLPHPIVWIENPLEYLMVALAGFFPMRQGKSLSFKELFGKMGENGIISGFKSLKADFFGWLYDTRGIVISSILKYIVVILGSAVYVVAYMRLSYPGAVIFSIIMEWKSAFPGLIFCMVVVPVLVKYRMDFKDHRRLHEYNYQEAGNVPIDKSNDPKSK